MRIDFVNPTWIERTAIHEAGHGVVACFQPRLPAVRYLCLSLAPGGGGHCQLEATDRALAATQGSPAARQELLEQGMRVSAAGYVAERIAFGRAEIGRDTESEADTASLVKLATVIGGLQIDDFHAGAQRLAEAAARRGGAISPKPTAPVSLNPLTRRLELALAAPWPMQPARFDEQAQRAVTRRVLACIDQSFVVAEFLLRSKWGAVERIAEHLIQCQTIPGELVRTTIATTPAQSKLSETIEQDARLMARAAASDRAIGQTILRALEAA